MALTGKSEDWMSAKKEMANGPLFVERLQRFDPSKVPAKNLKRVKAIIKQNDLDHDRVKKISAAAAGMTVWVLACVA